MVELCNDHELIIVKYIGKEIIKFRKSILLSPGVWKPCFSSKEDTILLINSSIFNLKDLKEYKIVINLPGESGDYLIFRDIFDDIKNVIPNDSTAFNRKNLKINDKIIKSDDCKSLSLNNKFVGFYIKQRSKNGWRTYFVHNDKIIAIFPTKFLYLATMDNIVYYSLYESLFLTMVFELRNVFTKTFIDFENKYKEGVLCNFKPSESYIEICLLHKFWIHKEFYNVWKSLIDDLLKQNSKCVQHPKPFTTKCNIFNTSSVRHTGTIFLKDLEIMLNNIVKKCFLSSPNAKTYTTGKTNTKTMPKDYDLSLSVVPDEVYKLMDPLFSNLNKLKEFKFEEPIHENYLLTCSENKPITQIQNKKVLSVDFSNRGVYITKNKNNKIFIGTLSKTDFMLNSDPFIVTTEKGQKTEKTKKFNNVSNVYFSDDKMTKIVDFTSKINDIKFQKPSTLMVKYNKHDKIHQFQIIS